MTSRKAKTEPMYSIREGFPRAELDEAIGVKPTARPNYYENTIITNTSFMKKGPRFMQGSFFVFTVVHPYMCASVHVHIRTACQLRCDAAGRTTIQVVVILIVQTLFCQHSRRGLVVKLGCAFIFSQFSCQFICVLLFL